MELLADNLVEKLFSPPNILNPLILSIQPNEKKRLILDFGGISIYICLSRNSCVEPGLHTIRDVAVQDKEHNTWIMMKGTVC